MSRKALPNFPHRRNPDGTVDSICAGCFRTIATALNEAQLQTAESTHQCGGFNLSELLRPPKSQRQSNRSR